MKKIFTLIVITTMIFGCSNTDSKKNNNQVGLNPSNNGSIEQNSQTNSDNSVDQNKSATANGYIPFSSRKSYYNFDQKTHSRVKVRLFDARPLIDGLEKVLINIQRVEIGSEETGWNTIAEVEKEYDLIALAGDLSVLLGDIIVPKGEYEQIRIILNSDNRLIINGKEESLKIPSGEQTGIKLKPSSGGSFSIQNGRIFEIILDFDASKSIHLAGKSNKYILRPVINILSITEYDTEREDIIQEELVADSTTKPGVFYDNTTQNPSFLTGEFVFEDSSSPTETVNLFLDKYKDVYRISSVSEEIEKKGENVDSLNITHLKYQQLYQGLEVFGGEMLFHLPKVNTISSINGRFISGIDVNVTPSVSLEQAKIIILQNIPSGNIGANQLLIFNQRLITNQGDRLNRLSWKIEVTEQNALSMHNWIYFIDAHSGEILFKYDKIHSTLNRLTYTAGNTTTIPGTLWITEAGTQAGQTPDQDGQDAHNFTGQVYNYFFNTFGRDSFDNSGGNIISSVHYDQDNAFWNGTQLAYGNGFAVLDVIGHEFTHAVNDHSADLVYSNQSGALDESFADIFGVMIDNNNWWIGENLPVAFRNTIGCNNGTLTNYALRDFENPRNCGQPALMTDFVTTTADHGGVHTNSGIPNRAAFLVGSNIRRPKTERIYYRALTNYLFGVAQFHDSRNAVIGSTIDFINSGSHSFVNSDLPTVLNAFRTVGIGSGYTYEGIAGYIQTSQIAGTHPLYRWYHNTTGDHFYTDDQNETLSGYTFEGIIGYLHNNTDPDIDVPLYRWYQPNDIDHFYTGDPNGELAPDLNYVFEGIVGYISSNQKPSTAALYRWFCPSLSDHFYTTDPNGELAPQLNCDYEGISGYIYTEQVDGSTLLYRWFQGDSLDHFYTTDPSGELAVQAGYTYEGTVGYVKIAVPLPQKAALYRYYNPHLGDHFYTTHPGGEIALQVGYKYEGFVGYIDTTSVSGSLAFHRWYNPFSHDHFYTTAPDGELAGISTISVSAGTSISSPTVIRR